MPRVVKQPSAGLSLSGRKRWSAHSFPFANWGTGRKRDEGGKKKSRTVGSFEERRF